MSASLPQNTDDIGEVECTEARNADLPLFKIVGEGGVAAGIRRVEAVTGKGALAWDHPLLVLEQVHQKVELLGRELDLHLSSPGPVRAGIEPEIADLEAFLNTLTDGYKPLQLRK